MKIKTNIVQRIILLIYLFSSNVLLSQPSLHIGNVKVNWPEVSFQLTVNCNGVYQTNLTTKNLTIVENGKPIWDYLLTQTAPNSSIYELKYMIICCIVDRFVDFTVHDIPGCPGSDFRSIKYLRPKPDTSTFSPVTIKLGQGSVFGGDTVSVPLLLETPIGGNLFHPSTFNLLFDDECTQVQSIVTKGYLLDGIDADMIRISGGFQFTWLKPKLLQDAGILAMLKFKASNPETDKECPLKLFGWRFDGGCFRPVLVDGKIIITAKRPNASGDFDTPAQLKIDQYSKEYQPNPIPIIVTVTNIGDRETRHGVATLLYNKNDFSLLSPSSIKQKLFPWIIQANGGYASVRWDVYARKRMHSDSVIIGTSITFDNHPEIEMDRKIFIPASPLTEIENVDTNPTSFYLGQNYPNPFTGMTNVEFGMRNQVNSALHNSHSALSFKVYDIFGREILDLSNKIENGKLTIENSQLPSPGIYFYRLIIGNESQTKMMTLIN